MQQLLDTFFVQLSADGATPASTLKAYRTDLTQCVSFLTEHGIVDIQALEPDHLQAFCAWLEQHGYAAATIARRIAALRAFGAFLLDLGMLTSDPCATLSSPVVTRTPRATVTSEQIAALRALMEQDTTAEGWRDRAMLEVLLATALRASDLVALDVGDIVLEAATVTVRCRKTRALALTPAAVMTLATYLHLARPKLLRTGTSEPALFLNRQGERLTRQGYWILLKQRARQLRLDGMSPEALRQSVASQRFADGASLDDMQALLGHAVRKTTAVYQLTPSITA